VCCQIVHHHDVGPERRHVSCVTYSIERRTIHGAIRTIGAVMPVALSAPTKVVVFQWPCGSAANTALAVRRTAIDRAILVEAPVSSMNTSRGCRSQAEIPSTPRVPAATSGRSCSLACDVFLKVMLWRSKNRQITLGTKRSPWTLRDGRRSHCVMSGVAATRERISAACPSSERTPVATLRLRLHRRRCFATH